MTAPGIAAGAALPAGAALMVWAVALSVSDIRRRRLPNALTLPGAGVILLVAAAMGRGGPALAGALGLGGVYLAVHLLAPAGMGAGDVKLSLGLGGLSGAVGAQSWALAAVAAPVITACLGIVVALAGRGRVVPHGPSMCVATLAAIALAC